MAKRLYVGKLPHDIHSDEVRQYFEMEARVKVLDCRIMTGFGFVEFETVEDAEAAVRLDGRDFHGVPLVIQFARENKPRREPPRDMRSRRPGVAVIVSNVSRDVSWQDLPGRLDGLDSLGGWPTGLSTDLLGKDLKDFGREAGGGVTFADIDREVPNQGILEYYTYEEAERAVRELDGRDLRGNAVSLRLADSRGGGSRRDRYYDDYRRDDADYRRDSYRRYSHSRSRSPRRYDDRDREYRRRSPPPPSRRYDERRDRDRDRY